MGKMRLNGASAERADFKPYLNFYTYSSLSGSTEYNEHEGLREGGVNSSGPNV